VIKRHIIRIRKPTEDHYSGGVNMPFRGDRAVVRAAAEADVSPEPGNA
jgi:hypothetical protein